jgi:hypothetical protein
MLHKLFVLATPHVNLLAVELHIAFLELAHFLNFVQVDNKALLQVVKLANTLPTEDGRVLAAVEVLDALFVLLTHVGKNVLVSSQVFRLETLVEIHICEERVLRNNLIQDIEVEGQFVDAVYAL